MKTKLYLLVILIGLFFCVCEKGVAQAPAWLWAKSMGGINDDKGTSIAVDASGNIYTTGSFSDIIDFDPGPGVFNLIAIGSNDIFISKTDSSGNLIWAKSIGSSNYEVAYSIALDSADNVYTTGYFSGTADFDPGPGTYNLIPQSYPDLFISKLDSSGNFVWAKTTGVGTVSIGNAINIDQSGNVYTTGLFLGTVDFDPDTGVFNLICSTGGPGSEDIFILKLDNDGNFVWAKRIGDIYQDEPFSIAFDASDNVYTTGFFNGTVDFDPGIDTFNLNAASPNMNYGDIFISKLDSLGNFIWAKQMGGASGNARGNSIALDLTGNIYSTGTFLGTIDFNPGTASFNLSSLLGGADVYISKLDSSGNFVWAKKFGGTISGLAGYGACVAIDASQSVYTTGSFQGTFDFDPGTGTANLSSAGGQDIFISKLDSLGNFIWAKAAGGPGPEVSNSVALDPAGNVYSTGNFLSAFVIFGTDTLNCTNSSNDIFIAKLLPPCSTSSTINPIACNSYASPSGNYNWNVSGLYNDTLTNASGCDSIITINLTIITIDTTVTQTGNVLSASTGSATYQWLDCANGFSIINGATNQIFAPTSIGNFAVAITQNGCIDTSNCYSVIGVGINNASALHHFNISPNPVNDVLTVLLNKPLPANSVITIHDMQGRMVGEKNTNHTHDSVIPINVSALSQGVYLLRMDGMVKRFVKM